MKEKSSKNWPIRHHHHHCIDVIRDINAHQTKWRKKFYIILSTQSSTTNVLISSAMYVSSWKMQFRKVKKLHFAGQWIILFVINDVRSQMKFKFFCMFNEINKIRFTPLQCNAIKIAQLMFFYLLMRCRETRGERGGCEWKYIWIIALIDVWSERWFE